VNRIDPSGNVTLTDVVATLAVNNILASVLLGSYNGYRLRGVRSFDDAFVPDAVVYGVSVSTTVSVGAALLPIALAHAAFIPAVQTFEGIGALLSFPIGAGVTVGREVVASARTLEVGTFSSSGVAFGSGGTGTSVTLYEGVIYNLASLAQYSSGSTILAELNATLPVLGGLGFGVTVGTFGNGTYRGFLTGVTLAFPTGGISVGGAYTSGISVGGAYTSSFGPYNVSTGIAAVQPYVNNAFPPYNFLLGLRLHGLI
jgi:hypothetical protein